MSSYIVANLLDKLKSSDSDFRFMALTDLNTELQKQSFSFDSQSEQKMIEGLRNALLDTNSEVQNNAVKCLTPLAKKITKLQFTTKLLVSLIESDQDTQRDIGAMSLKILINEIPEEHQELGIVLKLTVPALLKVVAACQAVDVVEVLRDLVARFGAVFSGFNEGASLQAMIMQEMLTLLTHPRQVVRKKSISVIASLAPIAFDDIFTKLSHGILSQMQIMANQKDFEKLITILEALSTLSRVSSDRMTPLMTSLVKSTIQFSQYDSDELKEQCLQALEVFVQTLVIDDLEGIVKTGIDYLAYDPNYIQDEMDIDDEEEEDEDEYSDDDDVSWKVRKAAVKLVASVMTTNPELLPRFYEEISPLLIKRFSERQENVRIEVVNAYISIVQATKMLEVPTKSLMPMIKRRKGVRGENVHVSDNAIQLLRTQIPNVISALQRQFEAGSIQTILVSFQLLKAIVETAQCGLEGKFQNLLIPIQNGLSIRDNHTNTNIKIEVLEFLSVVIKYHDIQVLGPHLKDLVDILSEACQDKFYKVRTESLKLLSLITTSFCQQEKMNRYDDVGFVNALFDIIYKVITGDEIETEVIEIGITTIASILSDIGDLLDPSKVKQVLLHLQKRLESETTRMVSVKAVACLCVSKISLDKDLLVGLIDQIRPMILKSNRYSSTEALVCLIGLLERCTTAVDVGVYEGLLEDLKVIFDQTQVQMIPLGFDLLKLMLTFGSGHVNVVEGYKGLIPRVIEVIVQVPHVVAGGAGLESLLALWEVMVGLDVVLDTFGNGIEKLVELASTRTDISKEAFAVMAKCVGKAGSHPKVGKAVDLGKLHGLVKKLLDEIHGKNGEQLQIFSLNCLGELGMESYEYRINIRDMKTLGGNLHQDLEKLIKSATDDVKTASALALGRIAISNISFYLPFVIERVKVKDQEYYYVLTLNEVIVSSVSHHRLKTFEPFVEELWNLLLNLAQEITEEGTRSLVSDCLGKLLLTNPKAYLPQLQNNTTSPSETVRATAVTAFRYTLSQTFEEYDNLLLSVLSSFLKLLQDPALVVRKMALSALNSCLHSKPHLLVSSLPETTAMLYKETVFKPELVVIVQMGPFQHKVDNGLDNRKIALDCMSSLLDHHLLLKLPEFISHLTASLSDPALEIKISTHSIFQKLAKIYPTLDLDTLISPLRESVFVKTKETAVKQQIEENKSLVFSALKTVRVLDTISNKDPKKEWSKFMNEIQGPESSVSQLFKELTI